MKNRAFLIIALILFLLGVVMIITPSINRITAELNIKKVVDKIDDIKNSQSYEKDLEKQYLKKQFYNDIESYNSKIYENGQIGLKDAWSYQQSVFSLSDYGVMGEAIGYLTIEAMDLLLPIYLGAGDENLAKGAAVLGETSIPIGGENTNSVIAAHRGWKGTPMFRDIEVLKPGDKVEVTNFWQTLYYEVINVIVINPSDIDAVKIQQGEDLLTLITCHPYTKNYQRYVVYCKSVEGDELKDSVSNESSFNIPFDGVLYESSVKSIEKEINIDLAAKVILVVLFIFIPVLFFILKLIRIKDRD